MQLRILWQAETWYDVKFCWSQWTLVELSIKGMSHSPRIHVSCGKSLRLLVCTVFSSFGSFLYFKHAPFLSPMCLQFSFYSEFLLLLNSEYLISSYSSSIQLPLQVATVFFPFFRIFHTGFLSREFLSMLHFCNSHWHHHFLFSYSILLSILYFIQYWEGRLAGILCQKLKGWKQRVLQKRIELFIVEKISVIF